MAYISNQTQAGGGADLYSVPASRPSGSLSQDPHQPINGSILTPDAPTNSAGQTAPQALAQGMGLVDRGGPGSSYSVDPNGGITTTVKGSDPFAARLSTLSQMGLLNHDTPPAQAPAAPAGPVSVGGSNEAASTAAFARAKDRAGLLAQKGLEGVKSVMASRGLGGSTIEQGGVNDVFAGATNALGDVSRDIAMQEAKRGGEIADRERAAGITLRGQDVDLAKANQLAKNAEMNSMISLINAAGAY